MKWLFNLWPSKQDTIDVTTEEEPVPSVPPPAWKKDEPPDVASLSRQIVSLREECARLERIVRDVQSRCVCEDANQRETIATRIARLEESFPVGWSTSAWYTKKSGDVWLNVSDRRTGWFVSVHSARNDQSGGLESGPYETMSEAIANAESLAKRLIAEMDDRTIIAGNVATNVCSENVG